LPSSRIAPGAIELAAQGLARCLEFLNLSGSDGYRSLFLGLGLECCLLEPLPQSSGGGVELGRFVLGGGVEALDLPPVLVTQTLNYIAECLGGLSELSDFCSRMREGAIGCGPFLMARFLKCIA
jgi:hypothetical protein